MSGPTSRISFRFSADGAEAACLAGDGTAGLRVESWSLAGGMPYARVWGGARTETVRSQPVPTGDGRVLVARTGAGRHDVVLVEEGETLIARLTGRGVRLLPSPRPGTLGVAVVTDAAGRGTIERVTRSGLERLIDLPGAVAGGFWLDGSGRRLALNALRQGRVAPVVADLDRGALTPLPAAAGNAPMLLASPRSGLALIASDADGRARLGTSDDNGIRFPTALDAIEGRVTPLAVDPTGRRIALAADRGTRSYLLVYDTDTDGVSEVRTPPGTIHGTGGWTADGLRFPYSAPDRPTGIATVTADGSWSLAGSTGTRWAAAHVETLPGPAGPIEAVVYGGRSWRTAPHLVVALHGGPEGAWRLDFDPLFQRLAAAGVAVVAPNQRGSVGYGMAHRAALHGAWGVPDLADIRHVGGTLAAARAAAGVEPPALYGLSYGAHLALLCVARDPGLWSRCAAVAPFLSAARLRDDAPVPVRAMVDRLGGATAATDDLGPRDLWTLAPRIRTPLLIVHGSDDDVIPVRQSRDLVNRLHGADGPGTAVDYLEVPGAGHDPLGGPDGDLPTRRLVEFLTRPGSRALADFRGRPVTVSGQSERR